MNRFCASWAFMMLLAIPGPLPIHEYAEAARQSNPGCGMDRLKVELPEGGGGRDVRGGRAACVVVDACLSSSDTTTVPLNGNAAGDFGQDNRVQLTTDGMGTWVAVWNSFESLSEPGGTDFDIIYSRSMDDGEHWSPVSSLNSNAGDDSGHDYLPQVTTDGAGTWLAVWTSYDSLDGAIGEDGDILFARSTNEGQTWSDPAALNNNADIDAGNDDQPQLATDGAGTWVAAWTSDDSLNDTIDGDSDILFSRSVDNGVHWSDPAPLGINADSDIGDDLGPQLTTDGAGNWVAVWYSNDEMGGSIGADWDILFSRSTDGGVHWTMPAPLNSNAAGDSGDDRDPQVTTDGQGNWLAVWGSADDLDGAIDSDWDILVARSTNGGESWTAKSPLNGSAAGDDGDDWDPQISTDGAGLWVAVWSSLSTFEGALGKDEDILVAASSDAGANWSLPAPLSGAAFDDLGWDGFPQLTCDGLGHWLAVWSSEEDLGGVIGVDVDVLYVAPRFDLMGDDCDCNGSADACDIALGRTDDWNGNEIPDTCDLPGDFDGDGLVGLGDLASLTDCLTEPCAAYCDPALYADPACAFFDVIRDGDVDLEDVASIQVAFGTQQTP